MLISFVVCLSLFAFIGLFSVRKSRGTKEDYYLASGTVNPWLVGLSAVATNNSGYMFIGVIGYTYVTGLAAIWLMVGWILGDFLASLYVHAKLRDATQQTGEVSYAGVLSHWYQQDFRLLQFLIGLVSLVFLLTYAAAQLVAGSKALHVLLGWPLWSGAVVGAVLVSLYCFAGGIRASIWTDAAQSFVMMLAMATLLFVGLDHLGGVSSVLNQMQTIVGFTDWVPNNLILPGVLGGGLFILSWLFAGLSVIGQPHIMVRFMTLNNSGGMWQARIWYYLWFSLFYGMATGVGLLSRLYLGDTGSFDAELALPTMAQQLLPATLAGLVLAGIFAATISTADSLILSCSAAVTHDLLPHKVERLWLLKLATIVITLVALMLALFFNQSVFSMVILAWSGLAGAFVPLLLVLCLGGKPSQATCIAALLIGFSVTLLWRWLGWHEKLYEGLPAVLAGLLVFALGSKIPSLARIKIATKIGPLAHNGQRN